MLILDMDTGGPTDFSQNQFDFDHPVDLRFTLISVDELEANWEDAVSVVGTNGGTEVDLELSDFYFFVAAATYLGTRW
jgi:hypothetical protein